MSSASSYIENNLVPQKLIIRCYVLTCILQKCPKITLLDQNYVQWKKIQENVFYFWVKNEAKRIWQYWNLKICRHPCYMTPFYLRCLCIVNAYLVKNIIILVFYIRVYLSIVETCNPGNLRWCRISPWFSSWVEPPWARWTFRDSKATGSRRSSPRWSSPANMGNNSPKHLK